MTKAQMTPEAYERHKTNGSEARRKKSTAAMHSRIAQRLIDEKIRALSPDALAVYLLIGHGFYLRIQGTHCTMIDAPYRYRKVWQVSPVVGDVERPPVAVSHCGALEFLETGWLVQVPVETDEHGRFGLREIGMLDWETAQYYRSIQ
jgi:hypothetical protein